MDKQQRAEFIRQTIFISEAERDTRIGFVDAIAEAAAPQPPSASDDDAAFKAAFLAAHTYPQGADQNTFRKGWQAGLKHARAALAPSPGVNGVQQKPIAYRMLHRTYQGKWTDGGRYWCDGAPDAELVKHCKEWSDQWRIELAYAAPSPAASADEWMAEAERLVDAAMQAAAEEEALVSNNGPAARAALLAHLKKNHAAP